MSLNLLKPQHGLPKKPSEIRDNLQHILGAALPDCILPEDDQSFEFKITAQGGLVARVGAGRGIIGKKYHDDRNYHDITLPARKACLLYKLKNSATDSVTPSDGYVKAKLPISMIDNNTVGFWDFTNSDTVSATPNSAVGISSIAVANNIVWINPTPGTSLKKVDGHCGYAMQGDGATGYGASQNSTGFPTSGSEYEIDIVFSTRQLTSLQCLLQMGRIYLFVGANGNITIAGNGGTNFDSNFTLQLGRKNIVSLCCDGVNQIVKVNGITVYTYAGYYSIANTLFYVLQGASGSYKSSAEIDYIELRNKMRTPAQIAQISNDLLLPCVYQTQYAEEYINGIKYYDISTVENAISSGDSNSTYSKGNAFKKDGSGSYWLSSQVSPNVNDIAYIGQKRINSKIKKIYHMTSGGSPNYNPSNIKIKLSYDLTTWVDIQTQIVPTTVTTETYYDVADYDASREHALIIMCDSDLITNSAFGVSELKFFTDVKPASSTDIRSILPANSIAIGYAKTSSTSVVEIDSNSYKYGIRQGAVGGNRKVPLGWKYFSGITLLKWSNPFGTRKIKTYYTWAQDANGTNESDVNTRFDTSVSTYGLFQYTTPNQEISIQTMAGGVTYFNLVQQTTGYIQCYCEVIE